MKKELRVFTGIILGRKRMDAVSQKIMYTKKGDTNLEKYAIRVHKMEKSLPDHCTILEIRL